MVLTGKAIYDLDQFSLKDMTECGVALRKLTVGAASIEEVGQRTANYLFDTLGSAHTDGKVCALARFFATVPFAELPGSLKRLVPQHGNREPDPRLRCLVLLGTRGIKPEWNDRLLSKHHQVLPLLAETLSEESPMIAQLMTQLGIDMQKATSSGSRFLVKEERRNYNVFFVPDALDASCIPAQHDFVIPNNIKSVVGFGGLLPSGNLFTVILFLRTAISHQTALAFRPFALNTKLALLPFDQPDLVFAQRH